MKARSNVRHQDSPTKRQDEITKRSITVSQTFKEHIFDGTDQDERFVMR